MCRLTALVGIKKEKQQQVDLMCNDENSVSYVKGRDGFIDALTHTIKYDVKENVTVNNAENAVNAKNAKNADNVIYNGETLFFEGKLKSGAIRDGAINGRKIAYGSITTLHIADNAITSAEIANEGVHTNNIKDAAITSNKIAYGAISRDKIEDEDITEVGTDTIYLRYRKNDSRIIKYATFPFDFTIDFSDVMNILDMNSSAYIHHTIKLIQTNDSYRVAIGQNYRFLETLSYDFLPILEYNADDGTIHSEVRADIPNIGIFECIDIEILGHKTDDGFLKFLIKNKVTVRYE
jgi:hypothetical protein